MATFKPDTKKRPLIGNIALQDSFLNMQPLEGNRETLRDKLITQFLHKRTSEVVKQRVSHINGNREIAEHIEFFFDEDGKPPQNASLKDITQYRKRVEKEIAWLDALNNELKRELNTLQFLEKSARNLTNVTVQTENKD